MMKLLDDWKNITTKAWSMRFWALAIVLSLAEALLPFVKLPVTVPPGVLASLASLAGLFGMVSRVLLQKKLMASGDDQPAA